MSAVTKMSDTQTMRLVNVDLYKIALRRGLKIGDPKMFAGYVKLLLGADAVHDFYKGRGSSQKQPQSPTPTDINLFINAIRKTYNKDIDVQRALQKLDNSDFPVDDNAAKKIANKIHAEFSLIEVDPLAHKIYCPGRKTDFTTFLGEYKRQIDPEPRKNPIKEYIINIDAQRSNMPLSTIITDIKQTEAAAKTAGCESVDFYLNDGITQMYDPAATASIAKLLNYFNFERDNNKKPAYFNITINDEPLIECSLTYNKGSNPNENTIILHVTHFLIKMDVKTESVIKGKKDNSVNGIMNLVVAGEQKPDNPTDIFAITTFKTLGDFLQIIDFINDEQNDIKNSPERVHFFITFDILCSKIAGLFSRNVLLEEGTDTKSVKFYINDNERRDAAAEALLALKSQPPPNQQAPGALYQDQPKQIEISRSPGRRISKSSTKPMSVVKGAKLLAGLRNPVKFPIFKRKRAQVSSGFADLGKIPPGPASFGKSSISIEKMSLKVIKNKLKSVGIKITKKMNGKVKYLTKLELIKKALSFKKLQLLAKSKKINIMYKNKLGKYKYKSLKRLKSDLKKQKTKQKTKQKYTKFG